MYSYLMGTSGLFILIQAAILIIIKIPRERGMEQLDRVRSLLALSFLILAVLSVLKAYDGGQALVIGTFFVSSTQAMLYTEAVLVWLRPGRHNRSFIILQSLLITFLTTLPVITFSSIPWMAEKISIIYAIFYFLLLAAYTVVFLKTRRWARGNTGDSGCDTRQLRWSQAFFFSALSVGCIGSLCFFQPGFYKYFVPLYLVYYSLVVTGFINYVQRTKYVLPVMDVLLNSSSQAEVRRPGEKEDGTEEMAEAVDLQPDAKLSHKERILRENLEAYLQNKEYCKKDVPLQETAVQLGVSLPFLRSFMNVHYRTRFSTWRNELRIHEACRLFEEDPLLSVEEVAEKVGYADNGNFCRDFKKITRMTPRKFSTDPQRHKNETVRPAACKKHGFSG